MMDTVSQVAALLYAQEEQERGEHPPGNVAVDLAGPRVAFDTVVTSLKTAIGNYSDMECEFWIPRPVGSTPKYEHHRC